MTECRAELILRGRRQPRLIVAATIVLFIVTVSHAGAWSYTEFSADLELRSALMATAGKWNPYVEVKGVFHGSELRFRYNSYTLGSYFRAAPWLKVGAFYRLQGGSRQPDDWLVWIGPDRHEWADTAGRYDHSLLLDATPRFLLRWMPGHWVGAVKVRYAYNFTFDHHSLLLRPGLTWAIMKNRRPVVNLSLQYAFYFALNFGTEPLYGHGPYLTALYHAADWLKLETKIQYGLKTYGKVAFGGPWTLQSSHLVFGVGVIFTPRF